MTASSLSPAMYMHFRSRLSTHLHFLLTLLTACSKQPRLHSHHSPLGTRDHTPKVRGRLNASQR